jgi:putative addiction module component (TIGR02574 family)
LNDEERAQVADAILQTLGPKADPNADGHACLDEIRRRADDLEQGRVEGISWEVVRAEGQALVHAED